MQSFRLDEPGETARALEAALGAIKQTSAALPTPEAAAMRVVERLLAGFIRLCRWAQATLDGDPQAPAHLAAARAQAVVAARPAADLPFPTLATAAAAAADAMRNASEIEDVADLARRLHALPVPVFQRTQERMGRQPRRDEPQPSKAEGPFVVKVMMEIDRRPWITPPVLQANTLYDLSATVTVPE